MARKSFAVRIFANDGHDAHHELALSRGPVSRLRAAQSADAWWRPTGAFPPRCLSRPTSSTSRPSARGTTHITIFITRCLVVRNWRVLDAFEAREADDARRAAAGLGPRRRKRRRRDLAELASAGAGP